jgi:hypothetical protein
MDKWDDDTKVKKDSYSKHTLNYNISEETKIISCHRFQAGSVFERIDDNPSNRDDIYLEFGWAQYQYY